MPPAASQPEPEPEIEGLEHQPGETFAGRYRLERPLGRGGMGTVWRARSLLLEIDVAVKVVPRELVSTEARDRLLREARAAASLTHPSIVRVTDFGTTDAGEPFLVMELLEGKSLGTWLDERQRLPAATAVRLLLPVIGALSTAHARGLVHRDIKPENIVVVPGEGDALVPKLVDFGIVKLKSSPTATTLTERGTLMGSPSYMSPEQARGLDDIDARADVWSTCVVLYELITGTRPFDGSHHGAVLYRIFTAAPQRTTDLAAGDEKLWEIIRRGLEKAAPDRWPSAKALGRELAVWAATQGITTDATGVSIAEQWLGRDSRIESESAPAPVSSRRAGSIETAVIGDASIPPVPGGSTRPPPRRLPGVALGVALAVTALVIALAAWRRAAAPTPLAAAVSAAEPVHAAGGVQGPPTSIVLPPPAVPAPPAVASVVASLPTPSPPPAPAREPIRRTLPPHPASGHNKSSLPTPDF